MHQVAQIYWLAAAMHMPYLYIPNKVPADAPGPLFMPCLCRASNSVAKLTCSAVQQKEHAYTLRCMHADLHYIGLCSVQMPSCKEHADPSCGALSLKLVTTVCLELLNRSTLATLCKRMMINGSWAPEICMEQGNTGNVQCITSANPREVADHASDTDIRSSI